MKSVSLHLALLVAGCTLTSLDMASAASQDYMVIEIALKHFASLKDADTYGTKKIADVILLDDRTPEKSGMLEETQISSELTGKHLFSPAELRSSLRKRNVKSVSLHGMKNRSKKIVVDDLDKYPEGWKFWDAVQKQHPRAKAYAETWLPGYSKDGQQAVVRFWFGPTAHGAIATYMLVKRNRQWTVKWHNLAFYA